MWSRYVEGVCAGFYDCVVSKYYSVVVLETSLNTCVLLDESCIRFRVLGGRRAVILLLRYHGCIGFVWVP